MRAIRHLPMLALGLAASVSAQDSSERERPAPGDPGDIVVIADRLPEQLDVPQAPLVELDAADIAGFGAGSIEELVAQLEPASGSTRGRGGGGRPVFLINGIRVSSFREFFRYPPEALAKVEVLPEEVAQRFGFPPDRRVLNFILKKDFSSREIEVEYEQPDRGGYSRTEQEFGLLKIAGGGRLNLNFEHNDTSLLTEAERGITQTPGSIPDVAGDPDPAAARSLIADSRGFEASANWAKAFVESGSSLSLTGSFERGESRSLSGLDTVTLADPLGQSLLRTFNGDNPLEVRRRTNEGEFALGYTRQIGTFQLTATGNASIADTRTQIDRLVDTSGLVADAANGLLAIDGAIPAGADAGFDIANTRTLGASQKVTLRGRPLLLPAGELGLTFDLGYDWNRIESDDTRSALDTRLTRGIIEGGVNVAVPLTSRFEGVLGALGDFAANFQLGFNDLSDFGTLYDWSAGLTWEPFDDLQLGVTYVDNEAPPSLAFLGNPQITSFNVPVFDFSRGETALVTVTSGGNPDLLAETQRDWKFSANWKLPIGGNHRLNIEYVRNRSDNVSQGFPALTDAIEAAFPDRVTRDGAGQLIALDRRAVTFAETRANRLSIGLNSRGRWGKARPSSSRPEGVTPSGATTPAAPASREGRRGAPNAERFAAIRAALCKDEPDLSALPERMQARLKREDGTVDPERLARVKGRICSDDAANAEAGQEPRQARGSRGGGRNPAARFGGRGGDGRGRYFLSLTHTIELDNTIFIAPGVPLLDQLDGDSTSAFGLARHSTRLSSGIFRGGMGMRIIGNYTGSARVNGSGLPGSTDLAIDDLATLNLRVFADLGRVFGQEDGFMQGLRLSLRADNVFDGRRIVRDENGDTPLRFQPLLIDPTGRYLGIDIRKLF